MQKEETAVKDEPKEDPPKPREFWAGGPMNADKSKCNSSCRRLPGFIQDDGCPRCKSMIDTADTELNTCLIHCSCHPISEPIAQRLRTARAFRGVSPLCTDCGSFAVTGDTTSVVCWLCRKPEPRPRAQEPVTDTEKKTGVDHEVNTKTQVQLTQILKKMEGLKEEVDALASITQVLTHAATAAGTQDSQG